jgi:hypothetical protein
MGKNDELSNFFSWIFAFTERRSTIEIEELNSLKFVTKNDIIFQQKNRTIEVS